MMEHCQKYLSCPKKIRQNCTAECPNFRLQKLLDTQRKIRLDDRITGSGLRIVG